MIVTIPVNSISKAVTSAAKCVRVLELIPVLERKAEVERKEKLLRDLGAPFVVKFISMM